jgi:hypothetical protein
MVIADNCMKKRFEKFNAGRISGQAGQALVLVMVFFLVGSLTLTPVLMQMATSLKAETKYENKSNELFTADAGIETGLWRIKYDFMGPAYDPYNYDTVWPYETDPVNHLTADVTVQNVWLPSNITLESAGLTSAQAKEMVDSEKLVISGTSGAVPGQPFYIKMEFTPASGDNLTVKTIGVWLPQGFTYTAGHSELEQLGAFNPCRPDNVSVTTVPGGTSVVWSYNPPYPLFIDFPNYAVEDGTITASFSFTYNRVTDDPVKMPLAVAWTTTDMDPTCLNTNNVPLAWDTDLRYYKVSAISGNTDIQTYSTKSQLRNLKNGIPGDYVAIGNSVMLDNFSPYDRRDTLLTESSTDVADVATIPADADVLYAYLYWSGFRFSTEKFTDSCINFNSWTGNSTSGSQTRVPTGDGHSSGVWNTAPMWDDVDETAFNDSDYIVGVTDSGNNYQLFTFDAFSIPDQPIHDVTVHIRARDDTSSQGNNDIRPAIWINGSATPYYPASGNNPGTSFTDYSYSWTLNPKTSLPWTYADITNPSSVDGLQQIGVWSNDLNPDMRVSMVYAQVNYNSYWSIYNSDRFQFQGADNGLTTPRYLTLSTAIDLSACTDGRFALYLNQYKSGTLEANDSLYYALSRDGGSTWSSNYLLFSGNSPASSYYDYLDPAYAQGSFKIRFYCNLNSSDEYAQLDNIKVFYLPADTSVTFKIDGAQVYFNGATPAEGSQPVTAGFSAELLNKTALDSGKYGYSYACYKDVSDLVKKYPVVEGEEHHNGSYTYTVGDIAGDTTQYISYAGWSLIIIYSSPTTAGRYIYLTDIHKIFAFNPGSTNLDFDNDGQPGGDVTGFLFPDPVRDKYGTILDPTAAKITCFVGEGDASYTGDSLKITGQQSALNEYLSNSASPWDNVWNGASPGCSYPGVDVDTFTVLWADGILTPKDTSLHLDMQSGTDAWNLVYIIMSVRSETVTSGTGHYQIDNN